MERILHILKVQSQNVKFFFRNARGQGQASQFACYALRTHREDDYNWKHELTLHFNNVGDPFFKIKF